MLFELMLAAGMATAQVETVPVATGLRVVSAR